MTVSHDAYARHIDPSTSHEAAMLVPVTKLEAIVLATLHAHPNGLTTHEIEHLTGLAAGSVTPRMKQLERKRWVLRTNRTRIPAGHRRKQTVWCAIYRT